MDATIDTMLREKKVIPMQVWYALKQYNDNLKRFSSFLNDTALLNDSSIDTHLFNFENLTVHLVQCESFTHNLLNTFKPNTEYNNSEQTLIYQVLAENLKRSELNNASTIDPHLFTNQINVALKLSLKKVTLLQAFLNKDANTAAIAYQKNCLNAMTVGLFNLFSQQYTRLFEARPEFRSLLLDRYDLVNRTLTRFNLGRGSGGTGSGFFLKMPLRDMKDFYERYKFAQMRPKSNQTLCDPQPPNLCKLTLTWHLIFRI